MSHSTEIERQDAAVNDSPPASVELDQLVSDEDLAPLRRPFLSQKAWALLALALVGATLLLIWLLLDGLYNNPPLQLTDTTASASSVSAATTDGLVLADQKPLTAATPGGSKNLGHAGATALKISQRIESWRMAWERRDVDAYLGHYSQNFVPANGQSQADWRKARQRNLSSRSAIKVTVKQLNIEPMGQNRFKATFLQDYATEKYQERAQLKTLLLERVTDQWQIAGEWNGAPVIEPQ